MADSSFKYIDLSTIDKNYQNNPGKRNILLKMYLDAMPSEFEELKNYLEKDDLENIHLKSHSIKTLMAQLGIKKIFENMLYIEKNTYDRDKKYILNYKFSISIDFWPSAAKEIELAIQKGI